jgi:hypothetical protein
VIVLGACRAYQPGSLSPGPGGQLATLDCLDVAVSPRAELRAVGPVVEIAVGNRCDHAVEVDFGAIRVAGHRAFDPREEIRPALLDGRAVAVEVIEYRPVSDAIATTLCLDISNMAPGSQPPICVSDAIAGVRR